MAEDRPGIVAAVSGRVAELGGNIEAVSQTVLAGHFTLIMIVTMPPAVSAETLRASVAAAESDPAYEVLVRPVAENLPAGRRSAVIRS